jgi:hypothetical protein
MAVGFGVVPAATVGVTPARRSRVLILVVGLVIAFGVVVGSVLSQWPVVAVVALFVTCVGASVLAALRPAGRVALVLAVPMVAVGFSYDGISESRGPALLIAAGAAVTWLVSLVWPARPALQRPEQVLRPIHEMLRYGVVLGIAAAACAAAGFWLGFDHQGWAAAACLLVMRPAVEATRLRATGRAVFVTAGVMAGAGLAYLQPQNAVVAAAVLLDLVCLAATRTSRWYVTGAFTTFIVISLLAWQDNQTDWVMQRLIETALGVVAAMTASVVLSAGERSAVAESAS